MSSLYNRATPRQTKVLRIVEGAVINAAHAHPAWKFDPRMARSIAKRAAGTLTAAWPEVLAAPQAPPDRSGESATDTQTIRGFNYGKRRRGASQLPRRTPLSGLHIAIGRLAGDARRAGDTERHDAYVTVLKLIAAESEADGHG